MPGVLVLLGLAALLRLLIERRSVAGITQDSLIYLRLTPHAPFAPFSPSRPSGYPLIMRLLGLLPGREVDIGTAAQHAAGLAVGAMVYLLSVRAGVRRSLALVAAGITLVDAYTVALEQVILAETFFTLTLVASVFLVVNGRFGTPAVAASGLLLALACLIRTVGLFVVPVWLGWVVLGRFGRRAVLAGLAGFVVPVLAYCTLHAAEGAGFSIVQSDGWYLYAKVAPILDCTGASIPAETRPLCTGPRGRSFEFYLYDAASPAFQLFHGGRGMDLEQAVTRHNNRLLRQFSLGVIRAHPLPFLGAVVKEFLRYLGPTTAQNELSLYPEQGSVLAWYERTFHLDWWLVAAAFAGGSVLVVLGRREREAAMLIGTAAALVLGAATTSGFNSRYLVPALPLMAPTLTLALDEASRWYRSRAERVSREGPSGDGPRRPAARSETSGTSRPPDGCATPPA